MRPSLLPGLIASARVEISIEARLGPIFEIGRRYLRRCRASDNRLLLAGEPCSARMAKRPMARPFDPSMQRPKHRNCSRQPELRSESSRFCRCRANVAPGALGTLRLGPKTLVARFGELHPGLQEVLARRPERLLPKSILMPFLNRDQAVVPARLLRPRRFNRSLEISRSWCLRGLLQSSFFEPFGARTSRRSRMSGCSTASKHRTASRSHLKSLFSQLKRASPTNRSPKFRRALLGLLKN